MPTGAIIIILFSVLSLAGWLVYASASIRSGVYVKAVCTLPAREKVMALTFDDGPDSRITPEILDVLREHHIKAIFFCAGRKIAGQETLLRRAVAEGHLLGNHSFSHTPLFPLLPYAKMKRDLERCEKSIRQITGQQPVSLFRPPYGVTNPVVAKAAAQLGCRTLGWSVRSFDTVKKDYRKVANRINKRIKPGNIILLHDTTPSIPAILNDIIHHARQQGYRFVRADKYL
ncbi:MAG: polysaccharide deacetylase family protein [Prevotellaceae bacterium]|jgi:peptidoglycan/xylan/chitin deacetylase (PgdA/CDA1 family)|nr:polysaccharide deacetylase family protein [Prevotellaceae bacterium]